ncbi:MAG: DoxX-like family protein [Chthoniobacterales bacterium]
MELKFLKIISRVALGLVWIYEGLVPKLLFLRADEIELVRRSGLVWRSPEQTLAVLGIAQIALGLWLITGWRERLAVCLTSIALVVLIVLVASGNPAMLSDPYGALIKDLCLFACAINVWVLSRGRAPRSTLNHPA